MFLNKFNYKKIPYRYYKSLRFLYKILIIKNCFLNNKFILFYYYNIMSIKRQKVLQQLLMEQNLKYYKIKKDLINLNFNNLVTNNILIIYHFMCPESDFSFTYFKNLLDFKDLGFIGI